jgi:methanethiol S-methyltransferase
LLSQSPILFQILLWVAFGGLHSLLAASAVKAFFQQKMATWYRYYRLIYNAISIGSLFFLLLIQYTQLPAERLWESVWYVDVSGILLALIGLILAGKALIGYDLGEFLGTSLQQHSTTTAQTALKTNGLLHYVRHPLYTGLIVFCIGLFVADALTRTLVMAVCVLVYIRIGIIFEEQKLIREFGDSYRQYRQKTPMLWPKF